MGTAKELTGQKFGRLTVLEYVENNKNGAIWSCCCDCGKKTMVRAYSLTSGKTKSCGCIQREIIGSRRFTHGKTKTSIYYTWASMLDRCTNSNHANYKHYGGRGITVCERWLKFENFYSDMGVAPEGKTLDRIDNDGAYHPDNCRWATRAEQDRNKRGLHIITFNGTSKIISDWAKELGIHRTTLSFRVKHWPLENALTTPKRESGQKGYAIILPAAKETK